MLTNILANIVKPVTDIIGKSVKDKDLAAQLSHEVEASLIAQASSLLEAQRDLIGKEMQGSWLQRNWRPLMMVWFAALVGAYWFGFTPENLSEDRIADLFDLVQIGIGGYIVGRSGEKIAKVWKDK